MVEHTDRATNSISRFPPATSCVRADNRYFGTGENAASAGLPTGYAVYGYKSVLIHQERESGQGRLYDTDGLSADQGNVPQNAVKPELPKILAPKPGG
jgi:hypothetical protein